MTARRAFLRIVVAIAVGAGSGAALAHAVLVESVPQNGAIVHSAPTEATLRFNVRVEQGLARASVQGSDRVVRPLALAGSTKGPTERLTFALPPLGAGEQEIRYRVLATDGHVTQGVLRFRVAP